MGLTLCRGTLRYRVHTGGVHSVPRNTEVQGIHAWGSRVPWDTEIQDFNPLGFLIETVVWIYDTFAYNFESKNVFTKYLKGNCCLTLI